VVQVNSAIGSGLLAETAGSATCVVKLPLAMIPGGDTNNGPTETWAPRIWLAVTSCQNSPTRPNTSKPPASVGDRRWPAPPATCI
jgi:hypothetical protein